MTSSEMGGTECQYVRERREMRMRDQSMQGRNARIGINGDSSVVAIP